MKPEKPKVLSENVKPDNLSERWSGHIKFLRHVQATFYSIL
jgi:hypothetical protein